MAVAATQQVPTLRADIRATTITAGVAPRYASAVHGLSPRRFYTTTSAPRRGPSRGSTAVSPSMGRGNYFAFFAFPVSPELDVAELQKRYHSLQRQLHPDQRQQQQQQQQQEGAGSGQMSVPVNTLSAEALDAASTYANEGYAVLKDPFLRCRYLSQLQRAKEMKQQERQQPTAELTVKEEEEVVVESDSPVKDESVEDMDEEFLMEVMSMNELIFCGDREEELVRKQMVVLQAHLKERNEEEMEEAVECWRQGEWAAFRACVHRWTYLWNALNKLNDRL